MTIKEQRQLSQQISIIDSTTNKDIMIIHKDVEESHKTLGCFKIIIGNEHSPIDFLKMKSDKFGYSI